jgi:hypothetical protein
MRNNCLNMTVSGGHHARLDPNIEIDEFVSKADIDPSSLPDPTELPRSDPGEHQLDTAATFDEARADFEAACLVRPIFRHGAMREIGPNGNMRCLRKSISAKPI